MEILDLIANVYSSTSIGALVSGTLVAAVATPIALFLCTIYVKLSNM